MVPLEPANVCDHTALRELDHELSLVHPGPFISIGVEIDAKELRLGRLRGLHGPKEGGMLYIRAPLQTAGENGDKVIGCSGYHSHHDLQPRQRSSTARSSRLGCEDSILIRTLVRVPREPSRTVGIALWTRSDDPLRMEGEPWL